MKHADYPALFLDADSGSNSYQKKFLNLIRAEYIVLCLAAVFSLNFLNSVTYHIIYAGVFFVGLMILISRAQSKPEQWWYRCRALAESVKTLAWRYMMHAAPFNVDEAGSKIVLRNELHEMFRQNKETAKQITNDWSGSDQITEAMRKVRAMKRAERMDFYLKHRVDEQRSWYNLKSRNSRKSSKFWVLLSGAAYVVAGCMVLGVSSNSLAD